MATYVPIVLFCLRLYIFVLQENTLFTAVLSSLKNVYIPSFILNGCCYKGIYVPIVMYGLRLFYKNNIVYRTVYNVV